MSGGRRGGWIRRLLQCTCLALASAGCTQPTYRHVSVPRLTVDHRLGTGIIPAAMLIEPRDGVKRLVRAVDAAQRTVFLEMYILSDSRILRALERAASQGVAVYVLLDPHPYGLPHTQPLSVAQRLRAAGVEVRWSRPGFVYTHAKTMILDDQVAVLSTANFSKSAFTRNREFLILDRRRLDVRTLSAIFRADWDRLSARIHDDDLVVSPDNSRFKLAAFLREARHRVDLYGEEVADTQTERLLAGLHARGIAVRLLLPSLSSSGARWLARHGVAVHAVRWPYIHAKAVMVDGREAFVGSENISTVSLDSNRELGILVRGRDVLELERVFSRDWSHHE